MRGLEPELQRLLGLGATLLTDQPVSEAGWRWYILADPDGNEFCVLQPPDSSGQTRGDDARNAARGVLR